MYIDKQFNYMLAFEPDIQANVKYYQRVCNYIDLHNIRKTSIPIYHIVNEVVGSPESISPQVIVRT